MALAFRASLLSLAFAAVACSSRGTPDCQPAVDCPLRVVAEESGVLIGAAAFPQLLDDEPDYAETLSREFNSLTPEIDLKWDALHPEPDRYDFERADQLVDFAEEHGMAVKGHTLIWAQEAVDSTPDWVEEIDDPDELRAVLEDHITTVMNRYAGRVDRWDVVNEPLMFSGGGLYENHFYRVLGPDYIRLAFELAYKADPGAQLFLNEHSLEYSPEKRQGSIDLVTSLVQSRVPIHGVGLQMHLRARLPEPGVVTELVEAFTALGLDVAITELDLPAGEGENRLEAQAEGFAQVIGECLAAGCRDITFWGFTDRHTWMNNFVRPGLDPLVFDADYQPKPAYDAVREQLLLLIGERVGVEAFRPLR